MKISKFVKLIELDGDSSPQVASPKETKVEPNAPLLQAKDKEPTILQSEKPEEVDEQGQPLNLMSTYGGEPLQKAKSLQAPPGTVASKLSLAKGPIRRPEPPRVIEPKVNPSLRLAPAEESFIPSVLKSKKKLSRKKTKDHSLKEVGIFSIKAIVGAITKFFEEISNTKCYQKTGLEGFECRKKIKLREIEVKINFLKKRYKDCHTKINPKLGFLKDNCIETTVNKLQELRDKYKEVMAETYKST